MASVREIDMVMQSLDTQKCRNRKTIFLFEKGERGRARMSDIREALSTGARNGRTERCLTKHLQLSRIAVMDESGRSPSSKLV